MYRRWPLVEYVCWMSPVPQLDSGSGPPYVLHNLRFRPATVSDTSRARIRAARRDGRSSGPDSSRKRQYWPLSRNPAAELGFELRLAMFAACSASVASSFDAPGHEFDCAHCMFAVLFSSENPPLESKRALIRSFRFRVLK